MLTLTLTLIIHNHRQLNYYSNLSQASSECEDYRNGNSTDNNNNGAGGTIGDQGTNNGEDIMSLSLLRKRKRRVRWVFKPGMIIYPHWFSCFRAISL